MGTSASSGQPPGADAPDVEFEAFTLAAKVDDCLKVSSEDLDRVLSASSDSSDVELVDSEDDADWVKVELEEAASPAIGGTSVASAAVAVESSEGRNEGSALDEEAFPCFAELLCASQAYASHSGCRFRSSDFSDLPAEDSAEVAELQQTSRSKKAAETGESGEVAVDHRLAARLRAAPMVARFAERLRAGERELVEEMAHAYDVVMNESVRNAMVAAFRELGLWPPLPAPAGIGESDCDLEDLTAPIPVIAQRAYNDEAMRRREAALGCGTVISRRRATTASYLVDFVYETGVELTFASSSDHHVALLQTFGKRVDEWESSEAKGPSPLVATSDRVSNPGCKKCDAFGPGRRLTVAGVSVEDIGIEAAKLWSECVREALWAFTSSIFLRATKSAGVSLLKRSLRSEMKTRYDALEQEEPAEEESCNKERQFEPEPEGEMDDDYWE